MVKLCIAEKRPYEFIGKEGAKISGFSYGAFLADGSVVTFTSQREHEATGVLAFDEREAVNLDIRPKFWGGTVKYREEIGGK